MPGLQEENERLRSQLEQYREQELSELRSRLEQALADVQHYKSEAQRNADVGRQIATETQKTIAELRAKLSVYEAKDSSDRRNLSRWRPRDVRARMSGDR